MTEEEKVKLYMRSRIRPIRKIKSPAKFLSFDSGIKMLEFNNIRFTQAHQLNDILDCDDSIIDFSSLRSLNLPDIDTIIFRCKEEWTGIKNWGICSLGKEYDNKTLWERYASSENGEDGICIVLNLNKVIDDLVYSRHSIVAYPVEYVNNVEESLPAELFYFGDKVDKMHFFSQLISTKNKVDSIRAWNWQYEDEVRLVSLVEQSKSELWSLSPECISKIYYGKDLSVDRIDVLKNIAKKKYPNIKVVRHW